MKTVAQKGGYRIDFNGSKTYFVTDSAEQCRLATSSLKKAENFFNKLLKMTGTC